MPDKLLQAAILTFSLNLMMAISSPTAAPNTPGLLEQEILLFAGAHRSPIPQEDRFRLIGPGLASEITSQKGEVRGEGLRLRSEI